MTLEWQGKYLEVHKLGTWEFAARRGAMGAAVILAITESREIVLVEQFRHALGKPTIELPAGLVGDTSAADTASAAAARELAEETGFTATAWQDLGSFATSPGMSSEMFQLFRATGLARTGPGGGVDGEDIRVHVVPLAMLAAFIAAQRDRGCIIDCRLAIALALA
jgi:ADP-ribose pyrophosphatase